MNIEKIPFNVVPLSWNTSVKVTEYGDFFECKSVLHYNSKMHIERLDADHYRVKSTGEIKEYQHSVNRAESKPSLAKSFQDLRNIINANLNSKNAENALWVTLTYAENMTDTERLYEDFRKFNMRLQYYCQKNDLGKYEYITTVEPQARGAWHHHLLLIWQTKAPFIANHELAEIWGHGFVKVEKLRKNVTNIGVYLTAYLTDLPLDEAQETDAEINKNCELKVVKDKKFIKGARLTLYPAKMRLFRCSKGIKRPKTYRTSRYEALQMINQTNAELQYKTAFYIWQDMYGNCICKECFDKSENAQQRTIIRKRQQFLAEYREVYGEFEDYAEYYFYEHLDPSIYEEYPEYSNNATCHPYVTSKEMEEIENENYLCYN